MSKIKWYLVQVQIWNQRHLVQHTVGVCCPGQSADGGLVWYHGQEDVQVVLKQLKVSTVFISQSFWQQVKKLCTMHPKGHLPCLLHFTWSTTGYPLGDSQPSPSITSLPVNLIPTDEPLRLLPQKCQTSFWNPESPSALFLAIFMGFMIFPHFDHKLYH